MVTNVLNYKENTTYLGVILDRNLTFETHTKKLNQKRVKYTGIFRKVRHFLPVTSQKIICNAFISSGLNYGSEIYVKTNKDKKNDLHPVKINTKLYGEKTISF